MFFLNKILLSFNLISSAFLLLACFVPYLSMTNLPILSIFGIITPILVVLNFLFLVYWILLGNKFFWIPALTLVFASFFIASFFQFRLNNTPVNEDGLKIMSFNSMGFNGNKIIDKPDVEKKIVNFIAMEDPDIICFQEFDYREIRTNDFDQYPYKYVDFEFGVYTGRVVQAIYSKYPIIDKGILDFPKSSNSAMFVNVAIKHDTIRIYNLHLQSLNIRPTTLTNESFLDLYTRLGKVFEYQQKQVEFLNDHRRTSTYKELICGDFNNTQFSNIYRNIRGNFKDTFIEKGKGYGRTYNFSVFPVRIDFILTDPSIKVIAHKTYDKELSDHFPIMATLRL